MTFLWMLEEFRTPFLDRLMQFITYFGQEIIVVVVICALYWCADKKFAYILGFTYFTAGLLVQTLKITFRIPRPWILDTTFRPVESSVSGATGYSFPSGHTQGAVCLFFPSALKFRKPWIKAACIFAFLLVGFSRMYLGCHTPKDVAVSILVSIIISYFVWHFQHFLLDDTTHLKKTAVILMSISLAVAAYAWFLHTSGLIETKYVFDCFKASGAGLGFALGWYIERTRLNFETHTLLLRTQIFKLLAGLLISLVIKEGFSILFGSSVLAKMLQYFILVLWVLVIYPAIFNQIKRRTL